jgi:hypothetical protein
LPDKIEKQIENFREEVKGIADQFREHIQEFLDDASMTGDMNFSLNIKIDNGVNIIGLISSAIGAGILLLIPGPGWFALVAGIVGSLISTYKAARSLFDSDYKKAQQRKAADENIDKIFLLSRIQLRVAVGRKYAEAGRQPDAYQEKISTPSTTSRTNHIIPDRLGSAT